MLARGRVLFAGSSLRWDLGRVKVWAELPCPEELVPRFHLIGSCGS